MKLHNDVLADQALEHPAHVADDLVEVEHLWLEYLLAAESQRLARQVSGALGRRGDLFQGVHFILSPILSVQEQRHISLNDTEDVVKVVRFRRTTDRQPPVAPVASSP